MLVSSCKISCFQKLSISSIPEMTIHCEFFQDLLLFINHMFDFFEKYVVTKYQETAWMGMMRFKEDLLIQSWSIKLGRYP